MSEQKQVKRNLIFNICTLLINIAIGIIYTPYLIKSLGLIAYGVVPLALIINQYVAVVTGSLTSALSRFYSIALQQKNYTDASKYLSTSLLVILLMIFVLAFPLYFVVLKIDTLFTIPENLVASAKILFSYTLLSFGLSLISSIFNITLFAWNRLDYLNVIKVMRVSFKLVFVVILFFFLDKDLAYVGTANFISELVILGYSIFLFYKLTRGKVKISLSLFDKASLSVLSVMASWVIIQQIGDTMLYRIDNIVVNKFWSTKESGILGAFTELGTYTMVVSSVIGSLFGPLILQAYAKENHETVKQMTLDRSISVGVLVGVMIGIICGFSPIILRLWLGQEFVDYNFWLYLKLFLIPFYSAAGIYAYASRAWNRVKLPAIWTLILGALNLVVIVLIAKNFPQTDSSIPLILLVCLVFGISQSYFLNGLVFSSFYPGTRKTMLVGGLKILVVTSLVSIIGYLLSNTLADLPAVLALGIIGVIGIVLLIISFKITLTRQQINEMIKLVYNK